jgi:acyl-CoA dehydrogenase
MDWLLNEQQKELKQQVIALCKDQLEPLERELGESNVLSRVMVKELANAGLFRLLVSGEYGNSTEMPSLVTICMVREQLARYSANAELLFTVQGLGSYSLVSSGTPEQKKQYCPLIASGEKIFAFALTEPNAGSDVAAIETSATSSGDDYLINGEKMFISLAPDADVYFVVARTGKEKGTKGLSTFLVERGTTGFDPGKRLDILGGHVIGAPSFKDCKVPRSGVVGKIDGGFEVVVNTLDFFRSTVGAGAIGMAYRALEESISYAKKRSQFGRTIADFQAIRIKLASMATQLDAARLLVYRAAHLRDRTNKRVGVEASMAKLFATEAAQRIIDDAVQIHGGNGVLKGSIVEKLYRQIRPMRIYEGTSEIQHLIIASALLKEDNPQ